MMALAIMPMNVVAYELRQREAALAGGDLAVVAQDRVLHADLAERRRRRVSVAATRLMAP